MLGAPERLTQIIELTIIVAVGYPIAQRGLTELRMSRRLTINLLMTIATIGALIIGEWLEATTVIVMFAIGEALEGYSADRARGAIKSLMQLAPAEALVLHRDNNLPQKTFVEEVTLGATVLIPAGERIPLDGIILDGYSAINEAPITGESLPIDKHIGDKVFAGTVNGTGALQIEVTSLAQDSTLSRIIKLVQNAQAKKSTTERFIDRFAAWYTPLVVIFALAVAVLAPMIVGGAGSVWVYRALALLVVACPCALVISTPVTVVSAMVRAAQQGVLIKGGQYLEALGNIQAFAFDKTGTLTQGEPRVITVKSVNCNGNPNCADCQNMLTLASAVEQQSEHPLGHAIVSYAQHQGIAMMTAQGVQTLIGRGIRGRVQDTPITVGSHTFFDAEYPHTATLCSDVKTHEAQGETVMMVARENNVLGYISVADTVRPESAAMLKALPAGSHTIMLTGDNETVARSIADKLGMDDIRANLLPKDKLQSVQDLVEQYGQVAMVGDGINDAPALASATVGIAMGNTAQAMETADVVLMQNDLSRLPFAVQLSRHATQIIQANIVLSLLLKAVFVVLTVLGFTTLWMAVFADMGLSLLVTLNGMRLLRFGAHPTAEHI